ncbi:transcriptional repressor CTCF isoform X2 [Drosophila sulfurigaster albostrigata]|nr:transcriptional repressor CTCF isoform X2 [Drosophila sulfurigaster albostrigata]XP_062129730.1 transcriptional repressor CTCF isoform X2 [Drosophila sulfurigaster albostrigata]
MPNRSRDSDSEDLQSFLMNFHKEIEDNAAKENASVVASNANGGGDDEEEEDADKYFIDDEGNCYIKTKPKKQLKSKTKEKAPVASTPAAITVRASGSSTSKAINLRPANSKVDSTPQRTAKVVNTRPGPQKKTPNKTTSTPRAYLRSANAKSQTKTSKTEVISNKVVIDNVDELEELVDDPDVNDSKDENETMDSITIDEPASVTAAAVSDDEIFEFDDNPANMSAKADVDFVVSGKQYKLKAVAAPSAAGAQKFACSHCSYTSNKKFLISRHVRSHDTEFSFKCSICERGFKTNVGLVNHLNTHMGNKPHKCKQCDSAFTTSGELIRHTRYKHTKEKPHKCTECSYASVELTKLRRHMTCHTGERPYQCPHCTYASQDMFKLKRHLVIHTGEKKYQCDICKSRFTQSNSLKAHKLIHSVVDKPIFQCTLCPTTCGRKADLRTHVANMHTSDTPFICKRCGQELPDRYLYKLHLKTHDGEKCYRCTLCSYASVSQRHLDSHMHIHTDSKPFQCDLCPQAFRQRQLLRRHRNLLHDEDYKQPEPREKVHSCPNCSRVFYRKGNLMRHMERHDASLNSREKQLKLKMGRNVRLQPDGSITTLVNGVDMDALRETSEDMSIDLEDQYEISDFVDLDEDADEKVSDENQVKSSAISTLRAKKTPNNERDREREKKKNQRKLVIINRQLKAPRGQTEVVSQGGTFRIKEEPDAGDFTVELQDEDEQFIVELVNDDNEVVVKREPNNQKINANNCFGFEDDADAEYDDYVEHATEVDATSQEFMQLMDMIEQDT